MTSNDRPRSNFPFNTSEPNKDDLMTDEEQQQLEAEMNDTEEFDDDDDTVSTDAVTVEETQTTLETGVQNSATEEEAQQAASDKSVPQDAESANEQKVSAYRKRLNEKGLDAFPLEAPKELVDMLRVAAEQAGGLALAALTRKLIAKHVNSLDLTHEDPVTHQIVPWKFDEAKLDEARSRTSTRGLTEEQKKARAEQTKQNQKAERELVKQLLAAHRAKLRGGDPSAKALEDTLSANGSGK